jgi:hypothetical protein
MSAARQTAAPKGRKTLAQGKAPGAAALGHVPDNIPSPERAEESGNANSKPLEFDGIRKQAGLPPIQPLAFSLQPCF